MSPGGPAARVAVSIVIAAILSSGGLAPSVRAAAPDRSDVVLVLDFSASILNDKANRDRFGAALERIADRVDATSSDLVAGDATVSIVQFAASAADYTGCADLRLLDSAETVARFADCLRSVAGAYRKGIDPALTQRIGIDTNYVAAMQQAATHLPLDAVRPALILFTDGKHDVKGVPVSQVQVVLDGLFGTRSPFALLPVGMGLQPKERGALEAGLVAMRITKEMPACISGATFDWPQVVFQSPAEAGNAVAVALQDATCTFTVGPAPTPPPTGTQTIGVVRAIRVAARDGRIELTWAPVAASAAGAPAIVDYRIRCRAGDGDWIESKEGVSLQRQAVVEGLTNGVAYQCEVAVVGQSSDGPWVAAATTVTPIGPPPVPGQPAVAASNQAVRITVAPDDPASVSGFHYECSSDNGATWPSSVDVASAGEPESMVTGLTNGTEYVCRAFALNAVARSDASPLSDAVRPCGSMLECNPVLAPVLVILGIALVGGLIVALGALRATRRRGYVLAVVDVIHTANLGSGSRLGIGLVRDPGGGRLSDIVADRRSTADIRIRYLGRGRFHVTDRSGRRVATDGESIIVADAVGGRHQLVLWAFDAKRVPAVTGGQ